MPRLLPVPLLIAGLVCLPLAACGGDDTSPQAAAPSQSTGTPPAATTAPDGTATTPSDAPDRQGDAAGDAPRAAEGDDTGAATDAAPSNRKDGPDAGAGTRTGDEPQSSSDDRPTKPSDRRESGPGDDATTNGAAMPQRLQDHAKGGAPASKDEADDIRAAINGFQEAIAEKDAAKACSHTTGMPMTSDAGKPTLSCEMLAQGGSPPPTEENRRTVASAKITVKGDKASVELGAGVPMPFRKVDGTWRIDYGTLLDADGGSR